MTARTTRKTTTADKPKAPAATKATARGKAEAAPATDAAAAPKTRKTGTKPAPSPEPAAVPAAPRKRETKPAATSRSGAGQAAATPASAAPTVRVEAGVEPASIQVDAGRRHQLICEIAYGIFAARGYIGGRELSDWLQAEAEVDRMLGKSAPQKTGRST